MEILKQEDKLSTFNSSKLPREDNLQINETFHYMITKTTITSRSHIGPFIHRKDSARYCNAYFTSMA